jgi:hypothetical protein
MSDAARLVDFHGRHPSNAVYRLDANGNLIRYTSPTPSGPLTIGMAIASTFQVCR